MSEELLEAKKAEAAHTVAVAHEATSDLRDVQMAAVFQEQLESFFRRGLADGRFIPLKDGKMADIERFKFICDDIANIHQILKEDKEERKEFHEEAKKERHDLRDEMQANYVSREAFLPIRLLVYGFVAIVMTAVVGAIVALVVVMPK